MDPIFEGVLSVKKATKGTVVYESEDFGTLYVRKGLLPKGPHPESITVVITNGADGESVGDDGGVKLVPGKGKLTRK